LVKVVRNDPLLDAILIEETEGIRFSTVLSNLTRSNITLPLILFSEMCTPQLTRDAINNHVNNYLCTAGREPADYYQELSNLVVFTIERDRVLTQHSLDTKRLAALVELAKLGPYNFPTMLDFTLEKAIELTGSEVGYVAIVDREHNMLNMLAWSKNAQLASDIANPPMTFDLDKVGLWGAPVRTGKAMIIDDYKSIKHPMKHGTPKGHVDLRNLMMVPIRYEKEIVATAGVANKTRSYSALDEYNVESLFEELFKIQQSMISRNRYEADIEILGQVLDNCPIGVIFLTEDYKKAI